MSTEKNGTGRVGLPKIVLRSGHVKFREWSRKRDYHGFVTILSLGFHFRVVAGRASPNARKPLV